MIILIIFLICVFITLGVGLFAALSDMRGLRIPNYYSVIIIGCFALAYGVLCFSQDNILLPLSQHFGGGIFMLLLSILLYKIGLIGAGDSKLASAYCLWLGLSGIPSFLIIMSFSGGLLGVVALYIQKVKPVSVPAEGGWVDQLQGGANKVPYGVAILCGAVGGFIYQGFLSFSSYVALL